MPASLISLTRRRSRCWPSPSPTCATRHRCSWSYRSPFEVGMRRGARTQQAHRHAEVQIGRSTLLGGNLAARRLDTPVCCSPTATGSPTSSANWPSTRPLNRQTNRTLDQTADATSGGCDDHSLQSKTALGDESHLGPLVALCQATAGTVSRITRNEFLQDHPNLHTEAGAWEENRTPDLRITRGSRILSGGFWRRLDSPDQVLSNWPPTPPCSWRGVLWDEYG